jgi:hypothetical protein
MTLEACALLERLMLENLPIAQVIRIVTAEAEFGVCLCRFEGVGVRWGVVACFALGPDHRIMGARLEKLRLLRGMGIVADRTGLLLDGIFAVRILKIVIIALMAGDTKLRGRLGEEILLGRSMREVTFPAPFFLQNLVRNILAVVLLSMALEAYLIAFSTQEIWGFRCVGVVTRGT